MSETEHTAEPWQTNTNYEPNKTRIFGPFIDGEKKRQWIADTIGEETHEANAKRIVECVNACAGLSDPIKNIVSYHSNVKKVSQDITVLSSAASEFGKMLNEIKEECEKTGGLGYNILAKQIGELMFKHIWVNDVIDKYSNQ